jgi:hypothetical protein
VLAVLALVAIVLAVASRKPAPDAVLDWDEVTWT